MTMLDLWNELLDGSSGDPTRSFFDLGGDSLTAVRLVELIYIRLGIRIPVAEVFANPTLYGLTQVVERRIEAHDADDFGKSPQHPQVAATHSLSIRQEARLRRTSGRRPVIASFQISGPLALDHLKRCMQILVDRHEELRTRFEINGGVPSKTVDGHVSISLFVEDARAIPRHDWLAEMVRRIEAEESLLFDLEHAPLIRATVMQFSSDVHLLLLAAEHIVFDGQSLQIITAELSKLYESTMGSQDLLPALSLRFAEFAHWQRQMLLEPEGIEHRRFWAAQTRRRFPGMHLRADYDCNTDSHTGQTISRYLDTKVPAQVKTTSHLLGVSPFTILMSAFAAAISSHVGLDEVPIIVPVSGRTVPNSNAVVGNFSNVLPLWLRVNRTVPFSDLVASCATVLSAALAHQDMPYVEIVRDIPLHHGKDDGVSQVYFAVEETPKMSLAGLSVTSLEGGGTSALFDISTWIVTAEQDPWRLVVTFKSDLYSRSRITGLLDILDRLLVKATSNVHVSVQDLLSEGE